MINRKQRRIQALAAAIEAEIRSGRHAEATLTDRQIERVAYLLIS